MSVMQQYSQVAARLLVTLNEATGRVFDGLRAELEEIAPVSGAQTDAIHAAQREALRVNAIASLQALGDVVGTYMTAAGADPEDVARVQASMADSMLKINEAFAGD